MRTELGNTLLLTAACVGAVLVTLGVRQGLRGVYGDALGQPFQAATPHVQALATLTNQLAAQATPAPEALRGRIADEAQAAAVALAPIVEGPRLRGTFVDPLFDPAAQRAGTLSQHLDTLASSVQEQESLALVSYHLEHTILLAEGAGGGPQAAAAARGLWVREYARAFLAVDDQVQQGLDEVTAARTAGDREALRAAALRLQGDVSRLTDHVRALPVPPEGLDASQRYSAALPRLEDGLKVLVEYASAEGDGDPRVLAEGENRMAAFLVERREVLPRMRSLAAGERR